MKWLAQYPLLHTCFSKYVTWVLANVPTDQLEHYDLIQILLRNDVQRLGRVEALLQRACDVLSMSPDSLARAFGFVDDLLTDDPEKIHDVLAEPLVAVDLSDHGFDEIRRPQPPSGSDQMLVSDFTARRNGLKFAIEVKTVRMEQGIQPGEFLGDPLQPYWWSNMLRSNAITKIQDKSRRVLRQLSATSSALKCDKKLLVIYSRRLGPSTLLDENEATDQLEQLSMLYPEVDVFCLKLYFGEVYFHPPLPLFGSA